MVCAWHPGVKRVAYLVCTDAEVGACSLQSLQHHKHGPLGNLSVAPASMNRV